MPSKPRVQVTADRRTAEIRRAIGQELLAARLDQGISQQRIADAIGVDRSYLGRVEAGTASASVEILERIAAGLGGDLGVRFFAGTGSGLRDRYQAAILDALLKIRASVWLAALEVGVHRPARGVIDAVLARPSDGTVIAVEVHSQLRRLEQLIRWANLKRESLPSSDWWRITGGTDRPTSALLVLRVTDANRRVVSEHEATFLTAYPAATSDAFASLTGDAPWPGPALLWADTGKGAAVMRDQPPKGVRVGRLGELR